MEKRIQGYVDRLTSGTNREFELAEAASDIAILARRYAHTRRPLADQGVVAKLIALLLRTELQPQTIASVASAVAALVSNETAGTSQQAIAAAGAVDALCAWLLQYGKASVATESAIASSAPAEMRMYARLAEAVHALCLDCPANSLLFLAVGALKPLIALASSSEAPKGAVLPAQGDVDAMEVHAVTALGAMAEGCPEAQEAVRKMGGLAPLCGLCTISPNAACRESCAMALWRMMVACPENKHAVCELSGVEALVGVLIAGTTAHSAFHSGRALAHVAAGYPPGKERVMRTLKAVLAGPPLVQSSVPRFRADAQISELQFRASRVNEGRGVLVRSASPWRVLHVVGAVISTELEPCRARCAYEFML